MSEMPDHPTATPREPTMADAITVFEREVGWRTAFAEQLRKDGARPREVAEWAGSAAHYRNALAAMRAVEAIESGRVHGVRRGYADRSGEYAADADGMLGYVYAPTVAEAVALAAAFPTTPARDV